MKRGRRRLVSVSAVWITLLLAGGAAAWVTALFSERWFKGKSDRLFAHQLNEGPYLFYGLYYRILNYFLYRLFLFLGKFIIFDDIRQRSGCFVYKLFQ